jgi:5-methylcytosine-specific restriction endonuclease McrA
MSKLTLEVERLCRELRERLAEKRARTQDEQQAKRQKPSAIVKQVRGQVFALDRACICGHCPPSRQFDEMHELVPRSKTRGQPPAARFNVQNCVRLSRKCHAMVTGEVGFGKRLRLECLDPAKGAMGPIRGTYHDGRVFVYERKRR